MKGRYFLVAVLAILLSSCTTPGGESAGDLPLSEEPLTGKFVWHDLVSDDVERSKTFYGGMLGWTFKDTTHPNGGAYTLALADGQYVGGIVHLDDPGDAEYSRWLGYLSVADVDEAVRDVESAGGRSVVGPLDLPGIGRAAAVVDPQEAVVGLLRSDIGDPVDRLQPGPGQVVWNELLAADAPAATKFYAELSGAVISEQPREGGVYRVLRSQGRDRAGVMPRPGDDIQPLWLTHFGVEDVESATRKAAELGGEVLLAPDPGLRDGRFAVVVDPNGAVLALSQSAN